MPEKIKILYIDDELNNLVGFKASFRLDYNVLVAENTADALDILTKHSDIRIIFCDQRMPDKTGVEFFEEIRNWFPHPIRILITGYTDVEAVISAINRGHVFRYVKKPWADADIISAIDEGYKFYTAHSLLAIKNDELQKAYNELDKFAYSVSHDIRGPLSGIMGAIRVVRHLDDVNEIKEMLGLMENSVKKLDGFILSMHDYYTIQRGELRIKDIDLKQVIDDIKDLHQTSIAGNKIELIVKISQEETFWCDELTLKLVLNNLVSNAIKYQKQDNAHKLIELNVEVAKGQATIYVKDNGIGIPENYLSEIFNLFFRASTQDAGSGFGLYNVKDALLKLNGGIKVSSVLGEGAVFKVTIPNK
ncbi:MAG TPA: hybrid sensor histidine kinase/response regulator [Pedobacter sp.]|jgi:signal transduction histidine kinase